MPIDLDKATPLERSQTAFSGRVEYAAARTHEESVKLAEMLRLGASVIMLVPDGIETGHIKNLTAPIYLAAGALQEFIHANGHTPMEGVSLCFDPRPCTPDGKTRLAWELRNVIG